MINIRKLTNIFFFKKKYNRHCKGNDHNDNGNDKGNDTHGKKMIEIVK